MSRCGLAGVREVPRTPFRADARQDWHRSPLTLIAVASGDWDRFARPRHLTLAALGLPVWVSRRMPCPLPLSQLACCKPADSLFNTCCPFPPARFPGSHALRPPASWACLRRVGCEQRGRRLCSRAHVRCVASRATWGQRCLSFTHPLLSARDRTGLAEPGSPPDLNLNLA